MVNTSRRQGLAPPATNSAPLTSVYGGAITSSPFSSHARASHPRRRHASPIQNSEEEPAPTSEADPVRTEWGRRARRSLSGRKTKSPFAWTANGAEAMPRLRYGASEVGGRGIVSMEEGALASSKKHGVFLLRRRPGSRDT
ncbi:hypothetical protein PF005_g27804 [Phytophthora fragariae]|uniref:Uncharacterized protein n=1 Tax=Phytophthora fragariae TaxID=53985 RepID=A0A6A3I6S9_9STRA|nr:hypothetical protein PF003_g26438 [Phytophthora fragariae]KAE8923173.1 hypothetical protein PF009_g26574 [Phytophthora fragariae]KAE8975743.1 hypothetical protein PF011_g24344 [Phytophthora fragariae]KAE9072697.1 hypothetical protein PF010_g25382 [Phytophthora fragariae]KAE9076167.1 hypothetical protein PF007_g24731 [Phytophthora fragariae]